MTITAKTAQKQPSRGVLNPLSANPEKWSNKFKQIVGNLPTICLSVFNHFMNLALKGLRKSSVLKICSKFTGEHPCRDVISIKLLC